MSDLSFVADAQCTLTDIDEQTTYGAGGPLFTSTYGTEINP